MPRYSDRDAARDTGASQREVSAANHGARNDAYGSKEAGQRDYGSGGERFSPSRGGMNLLGSVERDFGLGGDRGSGGGGSGK